VLYQKGVPNQVAKAGVNAVTVIPCNSFEHEFGVLALHPSGI
jgi:hypothetical protein